MSIKRILVPLFGTAAETGSLETAIAVARLFDGHVEALCFRPDVQERLSRVMHGEGAAIGTDFIRNIVANADRVAAEARARFDHVLASHGVALGDDPAMPVRPMASWREVPEYSSDALARQTAFIDLIVVGRPGAEPLPAAIDTALFATGLPVLLVPPAPRARLAGNILIGWNPTVQAERAVARALPFLKRAERVTVLAVTTGAKQGPAAADVVRYLAWHGVAAAAREIPPGDRPVGAILLDEAKAMDADLLVLGAYSHSRLREMILGGVTRHVLGHAELPLLMAH